MDQLTKIREDSRLPAENWSEWKRAMVPELPSHGLQHFQQRPGNRPGYICINILTAFENYKCGIYEWKAVGTRRAQPNKEVYIGSTCRSGRGALQDRILEYCSNGSHKSELIDDALTRGYELWVRVKPTGNSKAIAQDKENDFLSQYNYAWNIRNNAVRNVLP